MVIDLMKEAREIVRCQPMSPKVASLRDATDDLSEAYDILKISCTREASARFVGCFTRVVLAIERITAGDDPGPKAGAMEKPLDCEVKSAVA